jgi:hypothetical protein
MQTISELQYSMRDPETGRVSYMQVIAYDDGRIALAKEVEDRDAPVTLGWVFERADDFFVTSEERDAQVFDFRDDEEMARCMRKVPSEKDDEEWAEEIRALFHAIRATFSRLRNQAEADIAAEERKAAEALK